MGTGWGAASTGAVSGKALLTARPVDRVLPCVLSVILDIMTLCPCPVYPSRWQCCSKLRGRSRPRLLWHMPGARKE
jgi:hypothetical protein